MWVNQWEENGLTRGEDCKNSPLYSDWRLSSFLLISPLPSQAARDFPAPPPNHTRSFCKPAARGLTLPGSVTKFCQPSTLTAGDWSPLPQASGVPEEGSRGPQEVTLPSPPTFDGPGSQGGSDVPGGRIGHRGQPHRPPPELTTAVH